MNDPAAPPPLAEPELPPPPERPDCCNGGCAVCVLEGYPEDLERWRREVAEIQARHRAARDRTG